MKENIGREIPAAVLHDRSWQSTIDDDVLLNEMGYKASFKREFTSLSTVSLADSHIMSGIDLATKDKFRFQHHGFVLKRRDDFQHTLVVWWTSLSNMVLDLGGLHVSHARYAPSLIGYSNRSMVL